MRSNWCSFAALLLLATYLHIPAHAEPPSSEDVIGEEITVIGRVNQHQLNAKTLRRIQEAYAKNRHFAPQAPLRFRVEDASNADVALRLWLSEGNDIVDLPISADGTVDFSDMVITKKTKLSSNRAKGLLRLKPEIFSPSTSIQARRLGDLRLECRIMWAIWKDEVPIAIRLAFSWAGEFCASKRFPVYFDAPFALSRVTVEHEGITKLVPFNRANAYGPPTYDKKVPDKAVVRLYP
jgi:hypothetical protein